MSSASGRISHVSDTALMTAACRALETERPDGWVRDPLAARLAGERGMAIAQALPAVEIMCFGVGMRTRILDDIVAASVAEHKITTVLSIGAGLDSRPWRLELPPDLRWVEVDLQPILDYKESILSADKPKCRIERMAVDLNDPAQRRLMFAAASVAPAMMITEGLLMYLPAGTTEALAEESVAQSAVRFWLLDLSTGDLSRMVRMQQFKEVEAMRASDNLDGEGIAALAARTGWTAIDTRTFAVYGMKHLPPGRLEAMSRTFAAGPPPPPLPATDISGVHLFSR